jgi:hypothetical protein
LAEWRDLSTAPRDSGIWLFLPGSLYDTTVDGRPTNIRNEIVSGGWDANRGCWAQVNRAVYPSLWNDAPMSGAAPAAPVLP